jgi:Fanconi anemia group M protein
MEFLVNVSPREYQKKILGTCREKNCLVVLPTGLGKTLIALMLAVEMMKRFPGGKVLFLAPTRPLADQHLAYFKKHLPDLFAEMQIFTGLVDPKSRKKIWRTSDIIFSTPQCIANDLRNGLYSLEDVCLLVEDEAHRCLKNYDYNYIASQYIRQAANKRILGLTASPGSDLSRIREICKNLSIEEVELRTRDSGDVKEYLQELEFERAFVDFPENFREVRSLMERIFSGIVNELRSRKLLHAFPSKTEMISLQKKISHYVSTGNKSYNYLVGMSLCAQAIKIQHALELLETQTLRGFYDYMMDLVSQASRGQSKGVLKLVSRSEFSISLEMARKMLSENVEHPKVEKAAEMVGKEMDENKSSKVIIFTQFRDTASIIAERLNSIPGIRAKIFVGQAMKKGVGLSQKEQKRIVEEFSRGEINVLCATCIGEEGLDIPEVNAVVFYEPVASAVRTIQRSGRTARLSRGKIIVLMAKKTRDESYYYASKRKERRMHEAIHSIRKNLSDKNSPLGEIQKRL